MVFFCEVLNLWSKDYYLQYLFGSTEFYLIEQDNSQQAKTMQGMRNKFSKFFGWWSIFYTIAESNIYKDLETAKKSDAYEALKYYVISHKLKV